MMVLYVVTILKLATVERLLSLRRHFDITENIDHQPPLDKATLKKT